MKQEKTKVSWWVSYLENLVGGTDEMLVGLDTAFVEAHSRLVATDEQLVTRNRKQAFGA